MNTEENNGLDEEAIEYIGFWARVWAAVIDSILVMLVAGPFLYLAHGDEYFFRNDLLAKWIDFLASQVFPTLAVIIFWLYRSATPGKLIIRSRIVHAQTGKKPHTWQYFVRYIGYFVASLPLFLGILWVGWDKRKQGWHDKLAKTVVIRAKEESPEKSPLKLDRIPWPVDRLM